FSTQRGGRCSGPALPASSRKDHRFRRYDPPGISLWTLWTALRENAQRAEFRAPAAAELVPRDVHQFLEILGDRLLQQARRLVVVVLGPAVGLGDDPVDHAELETVGGVGLEGGGRFLRLPCVPPEDHRAALRRD